MVDIRKIHSNGIDDARKSALKKTVESAFSCSDVAILFIDIPALRMLRFFYGEISLFISLSHYSKTLEALFSGREYRNIGYQHSILRIKYPTFK